LAFVLPRVSIPRKILLAAACIVSCVWFQTPIASAQRVGHSGIGGGHFRAGGRVLGPRIAAPSVSRAMFFPQRGGIPGRIPLFFRPSFFNRAPFLWSWEAFNSSWWLYCGPVWGWNSACDDSFVPAPASEHYLAPPLTYASPVYIYSLDGHPLVQLYLKDGTVYNVNDYWFADDQVHFTMLDDRGTRSVEQTIPFDDLDAQRTIDVNSRRGFRVVMRNQPLEQYLRDHPDQTPPPLQPQNN
jgi:hypothetical protein